MPPSPLGEPFVFPVGRDFVPREEYKLKYGYMALDEVSLDELTNHGITRGVSIYTTHTIVDFQTISDDAFYLGNPLFILKIPCSLTQVENIEAKHRPVLTDFYKLPEKLWHSMRPELFMDSSPENVSPNWYYHSTKTRMLKLTLEVKLEPEAFESLISIFEHNKINTLPLHLYHHWNYRRTKSSIFDGVDYIEEDDVIPIVNIWKDFLVVKRHAEPSKIVVGIAGDFHFSQRNTRIGEQYPDRIKISDRISSFAEKAFNLWKEGGLDYIVLNGDFIDYEQIPALIETTQEDEAYGDTNWRGFELLTQIVPHIPIGGGCLLSVANILPFPWPQLIKGGNKGLLSNIPVIWNSGDHDRLKTSYPIPTSYASNDYYFGERSHYNLNGLNEGEGAQFTTSSYQTGEKASHISALRWTYEIGRMDHWPLRLTFKMGNRNFKIFCLDTHWMKGELESEVPYAQPSYNYKPPPLFPLQCRGLDQDSIDALNDVDADDFIIIFTHAPAICLAPRNNLHDNNQMNQLHAAQCQYGTFIDNRDNFLQYISNRISNGNNILMVSGHVHFRSAYSYYNNQDIRTGEFIWQKFESLNNPSLPSITPEDFWNEMPCILITTTPLGPKINKVEQSPSLLLLQLESSGVTKIIFNSLEE